MIFINTLQKMLKLDLILDANYELDRPLRNGKN